jgi:hypothetical protein
MRRLIATLSGFCKVQEVIVSTKPRIPHDQVMSEMDAIIASAEAARVV